MPQSLSVIEIYMKSLPWCRQRVSESWSAQWCQALNSKEEFEVIFTRSTLDYNLKKTTLNPYLRSANEENCSEDAGEMNEPSITNVFGRAHSLRATLRTSALGNWDKSVVFYKENQHR
jgi:hypothetical protein